MDGDQSQEKIRQQIEKTVSNVDWSEESAEVVFVTQEEELETLDIKDDDVVIYLSIKMKPKNSKTADVKPGHNKSTTSKAKYAGKFVKRSNGFCFANPF